MCQADDLILVPGTKRALAAADSLRSYWLGLAPPPAGIWSRVWSSWDVFSRGFWMYVCHVLLYYHHYYYYILYKVGNFSLGLFFAVRVQCLLCFEVLRVVVWRSDFASTLWFHAISPVVLPTVFIKVMQDKTSQFSKTKDNVPEVQDRVPEWAWLLTVNVYPCPSD